MSFLKSHHLERRVGLSETILKGTHPRPSLPGLDLFGSVVLEEKQQIPIL
jgi:hypothetical protein